MNYELNRNLKTQDVSQPVQETPLHIEYAVSFTNDITQKFSPNQVNDIILYIRKSIIDFRLQNIKECQAQIDYLNESLKPLQ